MTKLLAIKTWVVNVEDYSVRAVMSDGTRSAKIDLRPMFERFLEETTS